MLALTKVGMVARFTGGGGGLLGLPLSVGTRSGVVTLR